MTGTDDREGMDTADKCGSDDNEMEQPDTADKYGSDNNEMEQLDTADKCGSDANEMEEPSQLVAEPGTSAPAVSSKDMGIN